MLGTRPEIIRLSETIKKLDIFFEHRVIHSGQNSQPNLKDFFFSDLNLRQPDNYHFMQGTFAEQLAANFKFLEDEVKTFRPDALVVLGDTNTVLAALLAKRMGVVIYHIEAGNRSFDINVPEETNRKIVDHISDVNLTYSDIAREYLLREGLPADRIIKTGSPMFEVLNHYLPSIQQSDVLSLEAHKYFVVSAHREENINNEKNFLGLLACLNLIAEKYNYPIIVSTHPRTRKMIDAKGIELHKNIQLLKPLGFNDYNALQMNSFAVLSDSGTISEESSILNFPALNIRDAHERPEAMEETSVMMVGLNPERVLQGLIQLESQLRGEERSFRKVADYSMPNVSDKIVRIIISYTDYIKRVVWSEF